MKLSYGQNIRPKMLLLETNICTTYILVLYVFIYFKYIVYAEYIFFLNINKLT